MDSDFVYFHTTHDLAAMLTPDPECIIQALFELGFDL